MWVKLSLLESHVERHGEVEDEFKTEISVVKYYGQEGQKKKFYAFYEWKSDIKEQSFLITTTTKWSFIAGVCGIILAIEKVHSVTKTLCKYIKLCCKEEKTDKESENNREIVKDEALTMLRNESSLMKSI